MAPAVFAVLEASGLMISHADWESAGPPGLSDPWLPQRSLVWRGDLSPPLDLLPQVPAQRTSVGLESMVLVTPESFLSATSLIEADALHTSAEEPGAGSMGLDSDCGHRAASISNGFSLWSLSFLLPGQNPLQILQLFI